MVKSTQECFQLQWLLQGKHYSPIKDQGNSSMEAIMKCWWNCKSESIEYHDHSEVSPSLKHDGKGSHG